MFIAQFDHFGPCMPGQPKKSSCVSGNAPFPISVVRPAPGGLGQLEALRRPRRSSVPPPRRAQACPRRPCLRRGCDLPLVRAPWRPPAGQIGLVGIVEVDLRLLHVARDVDEDGAERPCARRGTPP